MNTESVNRRDFVKKSIFTLAAAGTVAGMAAEKKAEPPKAVEKKAEDTPIVKKLIASAPILQNAAETSVTVTFAVTADAIGWVEYSTSPDMAKAKRVLAGGTGLVTLDDKIDIDFNLTELLRGKFDLQNIAVEGINVMTARKTSAALPNLKASKNKFQLGIENKIKIAQEATKEELNKLFDATDSILLIDEIETGLHKKYYDLLFPVVFALASKLNVQLFIATHSIEAIDAILSKNSRIFLQDRFSCRQQDIQWTAEKSGHR